MNDNFVYILHVYNERFFLITILSCRYSIRTYQKEGFNKIIDPDGGIHLKRVRLEDELRSGTKTSDERVQWPKDGWTLSLSEMPQFQHCYIFVHLGGDLPSKSVKLRRGAFKAKRDGYKLMKANNVKKVKFNPSHDNYCFFESRVKASMTRNKFYNTRVSLDKNTARVKTACCGCKAGATGRCKHVAALLYTILDYNECDLTEIPPDLTCTDKPQEWNKPRSKKLAEGPMSLNELLMIKHDYEADKIRQKSVKRAQRKAMKQSYDAAPSFARKISTASVEKLCTELERISAKKKPMIVELLRGNNCEPVYPECLQKKDRIHNISLDHDYCVTSSTNKELKSDEIAAAVTVEPSTEMPEFLIEPLTNNYNNRFVLSHCELVQCFDVNHCVLDNNKDSTGVLDIDIDTCVLEQNEPCQSSDDHSVNITRQLVSEMNINHQFSDQSDLQEESFINTCKQFCNEMEITEEEIAKIEETTRGQSENPQWFKFKVGRVTASKFGEINNRRPTTTPDRIVRDIFQYKEKRHLPSHCAEGLNLEPVIKEKYIHAQLQNGHAEIAVHQRGLIIDKSCPLLAASIDGEVCDPDARHSATGNIEMKYIVFPQKLHAEENVPLLYSVASHIKNACLHLQDNKACLKKKHHYYAQVQGGMGITKKPWCDFVVYTKHLGQEDLHIERIYFDPLYWNDLKKKLLEFCLYAIIPEILTQRVKRGKPLQPSLFEYKI